MAARLMENDAAEAVIDDDGHDACRAGLGLEHGHGSTGRLARSGFHINAGLEQLIAHHCAGACAAGLILGSTAGHRADGNAGIHTLIGGEKPLRVGDGHIRLPAEEANRHLRNGRVILLGCLKGVMHQPGALGGVNVHGQLLNGMNILYHGADQVNIADVISVSYGLGSLAGGAQQTGFGRIVGVNIDAFQPLIDANARAMLAAGRSVVNFSVHQTNAGAAGIFHKQLGKIAACAYGFRQYTLSYCFRYHVFSS